MKNSVSVIGSLFFTLTVITYIIMHISSPVFGEVMFPYEMGKGVFRFVVKYEPALLHLGIRMPKGELRQDRVFNVTIIDEQVKSTILKTKFNLSNLKKMSNTDMNKDIAYNYYSIVNLQNADIDPKKYYLIKIKNDDGELGEFGFVVFIRGLFH